MLDSNNRSNRDFSHFDKLSTEELRAIIHQDSMLDENEDSDIDAVLYIMEVLARREKEENKIKDIDAAWQSFKEDYYPYASDPEPLFKLSDAEPAPAAGPAVIFFKKLFKPLSIIAVVALALLTGTITSYALGFNLWGALAAWTHETFHFTTSEVETVQPFENLQNALDMYGITASLVPTWLPDTCGEDIVQVFEIPNGIHLVSNCSVQAGELVFNINHYNDTVDVSHRTYERMETNVNIYTSNGIDHYIMPNGNKIRISWLSENNECSILCTLKETDIYRMIDSIYER